MFTFWGPFTILFALWVGCIIPGDTYGQLADSPGASFGNDAKKTGLSKYQESQADSLKWKYATNEDIRSSPAIGEDGTIYIGSDDPLHYAIGATNTAPDSFQVTSSSEGDLVTISTPLFKWNHAVDPKPQETVTYTTADRSPKKFNAGSLSSEDHINCFKAEMDVEKKSATYLNRKSGDWKTSQPQVKQGETMSVLVLIEATVKEDSISEMKSYLSEILPDTRKFEGCKQVDLYFNTEDSDNMVLVETWESRSDHENYLGWRTETGVMDNLGSMLTGPPTIRYFGRTKA